MCQVRTAHFFMNSKNKIVRFKVKYDSFIVFIKTGASSLKKKNQKHFRQYKISINKLAMWHSLDVAAFI